MEPDRSAFTAGVGAENNDPFGLKPPPYPIKLLYSLLTMGWRLSLGLGEVFEKLCEIQDLRIHSLKHFRKIFDERPDSFRDQIEGKILRILWRNRMY
jgi:hypothetical protein